MGRLSLTLRAFLFALVPVSVVLICCFTAVDAAIHTQIRRQLREQSRASDDLLERANTEWSSRISSLVAKLSESAGLRAAVGLLAEGRQDREIRAQVEATIELQLRELQNSSGFDLLAVTDPTGRVIAAVTCPSCARVIRGSSVPLSAGLVQIDGALLRVDTLPIATAEEPAALLVLGTKFDLHKLVLPGDAALLHSGKVVISSIGGRWNNSLQSQAARLCETSERGAEAFFDGREYVGTRLQQKQLGPDYCLLSLRSLEAPAQEFTRPFGIRLLLIAASGFGMALLCTFFTSRSVSSPLRALVTQLRQTAASGDLSQRLTAGTSVSELGLLADAYNAVASAAERARIQLEAAKNEAQAANRLKDEFLINVSHEIRTPLNGILGMAQVLLETELDAEQKEFASIMRTSGDSLVTIIDDILTFSQLQTGRLALSERPFDFKGLLDDAAKRIAAAASEKHIKVELFYADAVPRLFLGDEACIRQIVRHLCDNALKFTDQGAVSIRFECATEGERGRVTVSIQDTGIGIAPADHKLIFEHFTQADGSLTRRRGGTGLGLALVKSLVNAMQGQVGVESSEGRGSRFWFTLSLAIPSEIQNTANSVAEMAWARC